MRVAGVAGLALVAAVIYMLPAILASALRVRACGKIAALNLALGWTVAGWAAALWWCIRAAAPGPRPCVYCELADSCDLPGFPPAGITPDAMDPRPGVIVVWEPPGSVWHLPN